GEAPRLRQLGLRDAVQAVPVAGSEERAARAPAARRVRARQSRGQLALRYWAASLAQALGWVHTRRLRPVLGAPGGRAGSLLLVALAALVGLGAGRPPNVPFVIHQ